MNWEWITSDERQRFEDDGYLVIPDAVSVAERERLVAAIDEVTGKNANQLHNVADIVGRHDAFFDLIDCPKVLPKIVGILGSNIWLCHSHFNVNPQQPPVDPKTFSYSWHRDGGCIHGDMNIFPEPRLALKVGFYFTDVTEPGRGETYVLPRSHLRSDFDMAAEKYSTPNDLGASPLLLRAGTAVIYDGRTVHSVRSPNSSPMTRKAIFLQYAFRWMAAVDSMTVESVRDRCDPVRAQLLGFTTKVHEIGEIRGQGRSGRYYPSEEELPIRTKLKRELGDGAIRAGGPLVERFH